MFSLSALISLLVVLAVLCVIVWLARYMVATIPIEPPLGKVIVVVVTVICCLYAMIVLLQFAGLVGGPVVFIRP